MRFGIPAALVLGMILVLAACGEKPDGSPPSSPSGAYVMDKAHYRQLILTAAMHGRESLSEAEKESIDTLIAGARIDLALKPDGQWTAEGLMAGEKINDAGSWEVEGDAITLKYAREQSRPSKKVVVGRRLPDGSLLFQPNPNTPGPFHMVRK